MSDRERRRSFGGEKLKIIYEISTYNRQEVSQ
jgi:hypothetical protein